MQAITRAIITCVACIYNNIVWALLSYLLMPRPGHVVGWIDGVKVYKLPGFPLRIKNSRHSFQQCVAAWMRAFRAGQTEIYLLRKHPTRKIQEAWRRAHAKVLPAISALDDLMDEWVDQRDRQVIENGC